LRRAGASKVDALKICEAWNKQNKPPLEDVSYKVDYHYELAEPYKYFYSLDPGRWTITDTLTLEKGKRKTSKEENEIVNPVSIIEKERVLYEQIYKNGEVGFIDSEGEVFDTVEVDGIKHVPIFGDELTEGAVLLPSGVEDYKDEKTLIEEIKSHIHRYIDVSPFFETIAAFYILLSWLYDKINTLPYLRVLGDTGTGKSRFLDTVGRLCYKACLVSGALTPAPIYRLIRKWHGTIVIDEGDFRASDEQNEVVKILNCGFERGRPVVRSQKDNPDNLQFLPTFSPKLISSRKRFKDIALESRCLTEITKETDREDIPYLLPSEFYKEEESLRNKLLLFRFKNRGKVDIEKAQKLKDIDVENRLKQAVSSFIVLFASSEEVYNDFIDFLIAYNRVLVEERATTYEGGIVNAISDILVEKLGIESIYNVINVTNVTETDKELNELEITATDIKNVLTEKYKFKEEFASTRTIGKKLRVLGITTERKKSKETEKTKALLVLETKPLSKLIKKYIPVAVLESYDGYESYIATGDREQQNLTGEKTGSETEVCDKCGRDAILTTYKDLRVCEECFQELQTLDMGHVEYLPDNVEAEKVKNTEAPEGLVTNSTGLESLIRGLVISISNKDDRGAMIMVLVNRIAKDQGLEKGEVKAAIDRMIQEGELAISQEDHGEFVKVPSRALI